MSRPGARRDHDRFCRREGWEVVRGVHARPVVHHVTYELAVADGRVLRTPISRPVNSDDHGSRSWAEVVRQLDVDEAAFWACADDGQLPDRGVAGPVVPTGALPTGLVHQLITVAGVPESEVAAMTLPAAMTAHRSRPRD